MADVDSVEMNEQQMLGILRRDVPGALPVVGVACNERVAQLLREEIIGARKRWRQPVALIIDPRLRCYQSEIYYSFGSWQERCREQQRWDEVTALVSPLPVPVRVASSAARHAHNSGA